MISLFSLCTRLLLKNLSFASCLHVIRRNARTSKQFITRTNTTDVPLPPPFRSLRLFFLFSSLLGCVIKKKRKERRNRLKCDSEQYFKRWNAPLRCRWEISTCSSANSCSCLCIYYYNNTFTVAENGNTLSEMYRHHPVCLGCEVFSLYHSFTHSLFSLGISSFQYYCCIASFLNVICNKWEI